MTLLRPLAVLVLLLPTAASAQLSVRGFELSGGYYAWGGDNVEELEGGIRGQLTGFSEITPSIGFGLTVFYGQGGIDGFDEDVTEIGAGGILRFSLGDTEATHVFADATLAWSRLRVATGPLPTFQEDGVIIGPTLGLSVPVAEGIQLLFAGDLSYNRYGEVHFLEGPPATPGAGDAGWHYGARVGVSVSD